MTKQNKKNFLDGLLTIGAMVGGAWLSMEILKALTKVYKCPNCGYDKIKGKEPICPNCKVPLGWK